MSSKNKRRRRPLNVCYKGKNMLLRKNNRMNLWNNSSSNKNKRSKIVSVKKKRRRTNI